VAEAALALSMLFLAGLLRGFSGFGFAIAAMPLLSLLRPPAEVVPVVLLLQAAISVQGLRGAWAAADWASLRWMLPGAVLATPLGLAALAMLPAAPVRLVIAGLVFATVAALARGFRLVAMAGPPWALGSGILAGLCNGLAAMPGPPVIAFYLAAPLRAGAGRAAMIVLFLFTSLAGLLPMAALGRVGVESLVLAGLGVAPVWGGSALGAALYARSPEARYRRVALWMLAATGVAAAARVVFGGA